MLKEPILLAKSILATAVLLCMASPLNAQDVPNVIRKIQPQIGATGSIYTLDYGEGHEKGFSIYGDLDYKNFIGLEATYRNASIITPHDVGEDAYLIGPRVILKKGRFSPYARVLFGVGVINYQRGYNVTAYSNTYGMYAIGGGIDLKASRHVNVRIADFEYQRWYGYPPHGLTPYGFSVGAAYAF